MEYLTDFTRHDITGTLLAVALLLAVGLALWAGDRLDGGTRE